MQPTLHLTHVQRGFNLKTILTVNNLMKFSTVNSPKAIMIKVQEFKNKVMSRVTILLTTCFFYLQLTAQLKTVITYKETAKIDFEDFKPNSEESNTDSSLEQFNLKKMLLEQALDTIFSEVGTDTIQAWKEGNFVVTNSKKEQAIRKLYEINSQKFLVINNALLKNKIDTFSKLLNCDKQSDCSATYKVLQRKGNKKILGYECINYVIEEELESLSDGHSTRMISVWVTDKIKPALPTYALSRLYKKILKNFTPLEIKEQFEKNAASYELLSAINIAKE